MRMHVRLVSAAVASATVTTAIPVAHSARNAVIYCGTVNGGGATWSVYGTGVRCSAAKPLIAKLAAKPHPSAATRWRRTSA